MSAFSGLTFLSGLTVSPQGCNASQILKDVQIGTTGERFGLQVGLRRGLADGGSVLTFDMMSHEAWMAMAVVLEDYTTEAFWGC
jgi:hypothetical protein